MQLSQETQTGGDHVRFVASDRILLASGERRGSFVIAAGVDTFDWPVRNAKAMAPGDCDALLALQPAVVIVGTGATQVFPSREIMAVFLTRRVGVEFMDNAAAARTFNVLLGEGRKVAAAVILP